MKSGLLNTNVIRVHLTGTTGTLGTQNQMENVICWKDLMTKKGGEEAGCEVSGSGKNIFHYVIQSCKYTME